jgi:hypothetical protein
MESLRALMAHAFKTFIPDAKKQGAINAGPVRTFVEDSLHNIWMATATGLSRYDMQTELFTNFPAIIDSTTNDRSLIPFGSTKTHIILLRIQNIE